MSAANSPDPEHRPLFGAAPSTNEDDPRARTEGQPAGFWIRGGARFLDTLVGGAIGYAAAPFGPLIFGAIGRHDVLVTSAAPYALMLTPGKLVLSFLGPLLYHSIAESMGGATLGKLAFGLRVVREDLGPASFGATFIRNLAYYIDALCIGMVAYSFMKDSALQQRLGDKWAHTAVVRVAPGAQRPVAMAIGIGLGAWFVTNLMGWAAMGY